jgi:hypothetical protein
MNLRVTECSETKLAVDIRRNGKTHVWAWSEPLQDCNRFRIFLDARISGPVPPNKPAHESWNSSLEVQQLRPFWHDRDARHLLEPLQICSRFQFPLAQNRKVVIVCNCYCCHMVWVPLVQLYKYVFYTI